MLIDILCRVVDNLGDIGFVYRLARALSELPDPPQLRLIVDRLDEFAGLCPGVHPEKELQTINGWDIIRWDAVGEEAIDCFYKKRPRMIIECFACGRPEWLDNIIFNENDLVPRYIVNLEYLTAEEWASEYHLLPSLTRSPFVQKFFFMPGIRPGTGGLLQDASFIKGIDNCTSNEKRLELRQEILDLTREFSKLEIDKSCTCLDVFEPENAFWFFLFSYEHDFSSIIEDLTRFHARHPVLIILAAGRSSDPFLEAWNQADCPFPVLILQVIPQTMWDMFLAVSDFLVVRGEETFARACLSGRPFLWECYPFYDPIDEESGDIPRQGQLPKVHAFLDCIRPFFSPHDFKKYEALTLWFNHKKDEQNPMSIELPPGALWEFLMAVKERKKHEKQEFLSENAIYNGFASFARETRNLGNLALNLLTFLRNLG